MEFKEVEEIFNEQEYQAEVEYKEERLKEITGVVSITISDLRLDKKNFGTGHHCLYNGNGLSVSVDGEYYQALCPTCKQDGLKWDNYYAMKEYDDDGIVVCECGATNYEEDVILGKQLTKRTGEVYEHIRG